MFSNIIYVLATSSLLAGSSLSFYKAEISENNKNKDRIFEAEDYLYLLGTLLFFLKATTCLVEELYNKYENNRDNIFPSAYQRIDAL